MLMTPPRILTFIPLVVLASSDEVSSSSSASYEFCIASNPEIEFAITGTLDGPSSPSISSSTTTSSTFCCANYICGLPCPEVISSPAPMYGIIMLITVIVSFVVGMLSYFCVTGTSESYFLAGRSFRIPMVAVTLAAASIDSNTLLGNADLSYRYHFWDGGKPDVHWVCLSK
jgi:hypothetical protein